MTRTAQPPGREASYGRLFSTRGFAALIGVSLATVLATSLQILALSVLVYRATGSALWSSVAFAAGFLPQLVGGAVLTSIADRLPARPLIAAGALLRTATAALLAAAPLPPLAAVGLVAAVAVVTPVPAAAQSALVVRLLPGELYVLGRSVFNLVSSGAQLAGLAVGGTAVAALGPRAALGIAAAVQALGLLAVVAIPRTPPAVSDPVPVPTAVPVTTAVPVPVPVPTAVPVARWRVGDTWRANAALLHDRVVRRVLLSWWVPTGLLVGAEALVVAYVGERGATSAATGILLAAFPAGAAVGDLVAGRWFTPGWRRRSVPWLFGAVGVGLLPFVWHPGTAVAFACFALASAGTAYQLGGQQTFVAAVPADRQGVAFGLLGTGMQTGQGLVPVVSGAAADALGAGATISLLGVAVLLAGLALGRLPADPA